MERSDEWFLGRYIYAESLSHRKGFDIDIDEDIMDEIYEEIGSNAMKCFNTDIHLAYVED